MTFTHALRALGLLLLLCGAADGLRPVGGLRMRSRSMRSRTARAAMAVRVAVCIAGQWRDWSHSWPHIRAKIVDALDADVYAVSDTSRIAFHGRAA